MPCSLGTLQPEGGPTVIFLGSNEFLKSVMIFRDLFISYLLLSFDIVFALI